MQYCYFLVEVDFKGRPTGYYKIGMTTRETELRKNEYKAGNPRQLITCYVVIVENAQASETALHNQFQHKRIVGKGGGDEWFQFNETEINGVIFAMDQQGKSAMRPVIVSTPTQTEQFVHDMGVGAWVTLCWILRAALWTVKPVAKHQYRDNLPTRALKYPLCWILIALTLFNIFTGSKFNAKPNGKIVTTTLKK